MSVLGFHAALNADEWRERVGFSGDLQEANAALFAAADDRGRIDVLERWLQRHQPCIFGQIAARHGFESYCILTEQDFGQGDTAVRDKIQACRLTWKREAEEGRKSGFIILAMSRTLAEARPDDALLGFARHLATLYLLRDIEPDRIYTDAVRLVQPTPERPTWEWLVGVNFFGSQGDGRWWLDHRVPGGIAFSMNSVGHMVKSSMLADALADLASAMGTAGEGPDQSKVISLERALIVAMHTIGNAQAGPSGKATELLPLQDPQPVPACPVELPARLQGCDHRTYHGYYDTDETLPSVYFRPDVERPSDTPLKNLDFTYLYDKSIDNPDYLTVGLGLRVRLFGGRALDSRRRVQHKRRRAEGRKV